jgi:hypothetical protein
MKVKEQAMAKAKATEPTGPRYPRATPRQTLSIPESKWEALKTLAPLYGTTVNGLIYHLVDRLLTQHGVMPNALPEPGQEPSIESRLRLREDEVA